MRTAAQQIGSNVRAEMARRRITQTELASHLDMSQSMLSNRLTGKLAFNVDELASIAAALEVDIAVLMQAPADRQAS